MKRADSTEYILARMNAALGCRAANGFPDRETIEREVNAGTLYVEEVGGGCFLYRKRDGFYRLNFYIRDAAPPQPAVKTVAELPSRGTGGKELEDLFISAGWMPVLRRVRLTRKGDGREAAARETGADAKLAAEILNACFSPLTACLPTEKELEEHAAAGRLILEHGGLLRFTEKGKTSEIRHLAVLPEYRRRGTARLLVGRYLSLCGGALSRVWTGEDNAAALALYKQFGYSEDGMRSTVLVFEDQEK